MSSSKHIPFLEQKPLKAAYLTLATLLLLIPSILFGYPILHGDSGVDISSGFAHFAPIERPPFYGMFIWLTSLSVSLWLVAASQAILTTFVLDVLLKSLSIKNPQLWTLISILILSLTTGLAVMTCQIKPDFFLPLTVLAIFSFLIRPPGFKIIDFLLLSLVICGSVSHLSHLPVITGVLIAAIIFIRFTQNTGFTTYLRKFLILSVIIIFSWVLAPSVNYIFTGSFTMSRVSNIFRTSKLLQAGIFQKYIHEKCQEDPTFYLCQYEPEMDQYKTYFDFLWDDNSFLYKDGCKETGNQYCWIARNKEFGVLVNDLQSQSKFRKMILADAFHSTFKQLYTFDIPVYSNFTQHWFQAQMARKYFPLDADFIDGSMQNHNRLSFPVLNAIQRTVVILSLFILVFITIFLRKDIFTWRITLLGYLILLTLIGNAFFTGTFAGISDRFQCRIIWMLPLYVIVLVFSRYLRSLKT